MNHAALLIAFFGAFPEAAPSWSTNYWEAQEQGRRQNRPLVVVIGSGPAGYEKLNRDGKLSAEVQRWIAEHYVAVFVDTSNAAAKDLAHQFGIKSGVGVVISDRSGRYQAYNHDGSLSDRELIQTLEQARSTQVRTSFYSPTTANGSYAPAQGMRIRGC